MMRQFSQSWIFACFVSLPFSFVHTSPVSEASITSFFIPSPTAMSQFYSINNRNLPIIDLAESDLEQSKPTTVYAQHEDMYGFRVILHHKESGELVIHRRQDPDEGEGGASSVRSSTRFRPNLESPPPQRSPRNDNDESPSPSPPREVVSPTPPMLSQRPIPSSNVVPQRSIGGPLITSPTGTDTTSTETTGDQKSNNSNIPIIAGVVAGSFAVAIAAGGIYIFRKFQLKPSQKPRVYDDEQPPSQSSYRPPSYQQAPHNQSPTHYTPKTFSNQQPIYANVPIIYTTAPTPEPATNYAYAPVPTTSYEQAYDSNAYITSNRNSHYR